MPKSGVICASESLILREQDSKHRAAAQLHSCGAAVGKLCGEQLDTLGFFGLQGTTVDMLDGC